MTLVEELRTKKSRDNRELLDKAADTIEQLQKAYNGLIADVKQNAIRDVCDICKHNVMFDDCEDCFTCKLDCPCRECKEGSNWKWRGER